jgi:hypothetical protein
VTINGISISSQWLVGTSHANARHHTDGTHAGHRAGTGPPPGTPPTGGLLGAVVNALSEIGVLSSSSPSETGESSDASSSSTQEPPRALADFMHGLMAALHAQAAHSSRAQAPLDSDGDLDGSTPSETGDAPHTAGGRHRPNIAADLQSLIQRLSTSTTDSSTTITGNGTVSHLQQTFDALLTALGTSDNEATLSSFLGALANNLPGATSVGNAVSTTV